MHNEIKNYHLYNKRVWLNPESCVSTGSLVTFHGKTSHRKKGEYQIETFVEFGDCSGKIKLHKIYSDSYNDFCNKLKLVVTTLNEFINYIEKNEENFEDK